MTTELPENTKKYLEKIMGHNYLGIIIPVPLVIAGEKEFSLRQKRRGISNMAEAIKLTIGITPFLAGLEKNFDDGKGIFGTDIGIPLLATIVRHNDEKPAVDDEMRFTRSIINYIIENNNRIAFIFKFKNEGERTLQVIGNTALKMHQDMKILAYPVGIDTTIPDGECCAMKVIVSRDI